MNAVLEAADRAVINRPAERGGGRRLLIDVAGTGAVVLGLLSAGLSICTTV
jgi:hypothetical protein